MTPVVFTTHNFCKHEIGNSIQINYMYFSLQPESNKNCLQNNF